MEATSTGQLDTSAAEVYENLFVPALFQQWARRVADLAELGEGQTVLDVACGTGVLAREAATRVGDAASVTGLDVNAAMLAVAARKAPGIDWRQGRAEELPFEDAQFGRVVSQFGLMFFEDRVAALREMWRVLKPGGRLTVAVWDAVEASPGYAAWINLLERECGREAADEMRGPFVLGDKRQFAALFEAAAIPAATINSVEDSVNYASIDQWVEMDVKGWTLGNVLSDAQYGQLLEVARRELSEYVQADGRVRFAAPAHIATAAKGQG